MITHIDWLSFTGRAGDWEQLPSHLLQRHFFEALQVDFPLISGLILGGYEYETRRGRPPYSLGYARSDNGAYCFCSGALPHYLVEVTGVGCAGLGGTGDASSALLEVADHLSRIDIAVDMLTDTLPGEFTKHRSVQRFKSWGEIVSESGETVYIGSKSSDRYARVYRYNTPHPRAHLLRCEFVLRGKQAQEAARAILNLGIEAFSASLGNSFGWSHPDWQPNVTTDAEARAWRPERRQGKTVRWVYSQVLPALLKLHSEGALNLRELYDREILPKLDGTH